MGPTRDHRSVTYDITAMTASVIFLLQLVYAYLQLEIKLHPWPHMHAFMLYPMHILPPLEILLQLHVYVFLFCLEHKLTKHIGLCALCNYEQIFIK